MTETLLAVAATKRDALMRYAQRMLHNRWDAEEVVQDTLINLWRTSVESATVHNPLGYIRRCLTHATSQRVIHDRAKKRDRASTVSLGTTLNAIEDPDTGDPDIRLDVEIIMRHPRMSEEQRLLLARYLAGYSHEEIARELGITIRDAMHRLGTLKRRLKAMLKAKEIPA